MKKMTLVRYNLGSVLPGYWLQSIFLPNVPLNRCQKDSFSEMETKGPSAFAGAGSMVGLR